MPIEFTLDTTGRPIARDGNFLCLKSSAYDTCMLLGQDPAYAGFTMLPQKVIDFYDATGFDVIEWAALGWRRGRGFSMKDPWEKFVPPDRGRKRAGTRATSTVTEDDLSRQRALQNGPDTWFSTPSASTRKSGEKGNGLRKQITDVSGTLLTDALIADLSKELRAELREHLRPQQWKPIKRGTVKVCRTIGEVQRACRTASSGNSTLYDVLSRKLEQEVSRLTVAVTVHTADSL